MRIFNILALVATALIFSSCTAKVEEIEEASEVSEEASLDGIWSTNCIVDGVDSYVKTINVASGTMTYASIHFFGDNFCNSAARGASIMKSGALTISGDHSSLAGAKNYDWDLSLILLVPENADTVNMFNVNNVCGSNTWTLDQANFVFGCAIVGVFDYTLTVPNTVDYGVIQIDSAVTPNSLQFGTACAATGYNDICTQPADRPATVSGDVYYRR